MGRYETSLKLQRHAKAGCIRRGQQDVKLRIGGIPLAVLLPRLDDRRQYIDNADKTIQVMTMKTQVYLVFALSMVLSGCAIVEPGERAVKVTMGTMDRNLLNSGLQFYNPATDQIVHYSIKQETVAGQAVPLTADQQPITLSYKVLYNIPEAEVLTLYEKYNGDPFAKLVDPQIQEAFRQVVSQYKADVATKNINVIKDQVLSMVKGNVKGLVNVVDIPITHVDLPEVLQTAINTKQVMEQQALQKSYELDKARREAQITIANAEAQARSIQLQSEALSKSPALIEWEKVKKWDGKLPETILGGGTTTMFNMK